MMKKRIILIVLFLIPVLIYLFLQLFGQNQYNELAIYHTEGIPSGLQCSSQNTPHTLPLSIDDISLREKVSIIVPLFTKDSRSKAAFNQLLRVKEAFKKNRKLSLIGICNDSDLNEFEDYPLSLVGFSNDTFKDFVECSLVQKDTLRITLVDEMGLIRGYYPFTERKEIDRLLLETNVLFYASQN